MYWRSEKEIIEEFVGILRRIFQYVTQLSNKDKELLSLPTDLTNFIFESFASKSETYPQIQVDSGGISFMDNINNLISVVNGEEEFLGIRALKGVTASYNYPLKVQIPSHLIGMSVRGFLIPFASLECRGGDEVEVKLYKNFTTTPEVVASGSLGGNPTAKYQFNFAELNTSITLTNEDYWLELIPQEDSEYVFGIDENVESSYIYYENNEETEGDGTIHASALAPAFIRIGGLLSGSILIRCSAKDDSKTARDLASVVSLYCNLLKQSQISRKTEDLTVGKTKLVFGTFSEYDEWLKKGIKIRKIQQNPINIRRRSSNEIIYESVIVAEILTEWFQDYPISTLNKIEVDVFNFLPSEFVALSTEVTSNNQ